MSDDQVNLHTGAEAREDARLFYDHRGRLWSVRERSCHAEPEARADRCLVFDSAIASRRVWRYPHDWRTLSDAELEELSWRT